ncbi:phage SPO1 DNA polymerase-related protein [Chloroherpeton thalassium ATCC 35110]|uniref:Type-4 uracil-DNA glycosylase n=1 Tax=Chloroherpeton thalassium (strain ATCC 35110 / GB-78) TaxID=517418 RepID=B3QUE7_CHLT3|nr:uracil-DNA glycosylase [Chloroherpeton thalassium]ACF14396.1 phage SPO1 DNA polymerase-related protein [Chloroherpeton thalassium ATCC 35110]
MQGDLFDNAEQSEPLSPEEALQKYKTLSALYDATKDCKKCQLGELRTKYVFGEGNERAKLVLIGEAPGADEDAQGRPFVGRSGQLLTKIMEAIHFSREEIYICNILKCRPPNNREPQADEVAACLPHLYRQLEIIKPKIILALGRVAANVLLENKQSMSAMRGKVIKWRNSDVFVTYHPAALLRNPNWKRLCWEDVQALKRHYDEKHA